MFEKIPRKRRGLITAVMRGGEKLVSIRPLPAKFRPWLAMVLLMVAICPLTGVGIAAEAPKQAAENLELQAGGVRFAALYQAGLRQIRGGLILLHGRHEGDRTEYLLQSLGAALADHGWSNLAIALPTPAMTGPGRWTEDAMERLKAGLTALQARKPGPITLAGFDQGAALALAAATGTIGKDLAAVVLVDPPPLEWGEKGSPTAEQIAALRLPVLEVRTRSSESDEGGARDSRVRMAANPRFRQTLINGPRGEWKDMEIFIAQRIHGWLVRLAAANAKTPEPSPANPATPGP